MSEQWQINRAGVINFWYYDEDEFIFDEGRLLLRGANGSGKSVTMQSLVPLLFDGNKSPERLDPFGSRARKMDSYLLSDGLDLEERIGYLFLEFAKKEAGRYITIGMGMRARKNMTLQTWYFIILDNRRVGLHYDLPLYKDLGDKIPLSQKELENRIGVGGHLYTSQKEYKNAVNEHLFGYEDISDFDELIELLIQIRSPKLSKEFKPTTMYEIMQNSLITLSDDDLRPMSEAIENMDEIKTKVDALEAARKSLQKIDTAYSKYNTFVLANKAQFFNKSQEQERHLQQQHLGYEQKAIQQKARFQLLTQQIERLEMEEEQLKLKVESLKQHDLSKLAEDKQKEENLLLFQEDQFQKKEQTLDGEKTRERQIEKTLRDKKSQLEVFQVEIQKSLEEMRELSEACHFDEHVFFESEFSGASEQGYNFTYLDHQMNVYKTNLKLGKAALIKLEHLISLYDEALKQLEVANKEKEEQRKNVKGAERLLGETKSEFIEKMFHWQEDNTVLKVPREVLSRSSEGVYKFGEGVYYDQIVAPVREVYNQVNNDLNQRISTLKSEEELLKREWHEKQTALEVLKAQKDPEPFREDKVLRNRERLAVANIPFIPLYKAIDFAPQIDPALKGHLEEALLDLGLLDALIVSPEFREQVIKMDEGMADKYIFANPELISFNLSQYLKPDDYSESISPMLVDDVLKSMFIDQAPDKFFITEGGTYGMGLVRGHISGDYESKFIGVQSRKRYKQQLMDEIATQMHMLKEKMATLHLEIDVQNTWVQKAVSELNLFPKTEDLAVAHGELQGALSEYRRSEARVERAEQASEKIYQQLKSQRIEVQEKTLKTPLPLRSEVFEAAILDLERYHEVLQVLKLKERDCFHLLEALESLKQQYDHCIQGIEMATEDILRLTRSIQSARSRIEAIKHELSLSDYQEIVVQLEQMLGRLQQIPAESKGAILEHATIHAALEVDEQALQALIDELQKAQILRKVYGKAFEQEYKLHYVLKEDIEVGQGLALKILKTYGTVLEEKKQLMELRDELQERLQKEGGELLEYNLKRIDLFKETHQEAEGILEQQELLFQLQRMDIVAKVSGKEVKFYELFEILETQIRENGALLDEQDRELFEDILIKSISRKISSKIFHSEKWVEKINTLMEGMNTSSGLSFSLKWLTKKAESEDQLGTKELVEILKMDQGLLTLTHRERLIKHFRSKIQESKNRSSDDLEQRSFLTVMKEILDYREWFEFQLFFTKIGDVKKELTNNAFGTFSGGEKAMAMYVPLFSAVYAKYQGGRKDCPKVISLDEAFAGVDDKNIKDMFKLLVELKLSFIANSQVLFGDYDTVPALSIYELIRPLNVTFVTSIRYKWNGFVRSLITEEGE